jgi:rhamnogalacturonyl hydrolase YesR
LLGPNGLFSDHIDLQGTIERRQWSYNQGAMVAAAVRLYQATGRGAYRTQAERIADAAVAAYTPYSRSDEPPYFLAIFFDDLSLLAQLEPARNYTSAIRQYADALAAQPLDATTGLVRFGTGSVTLLEQAAAVRMYAALAGGA